MSIIALEILNWPGDRNAGTSCPSQLVSPSLPCCLTAESGKARVSLPTPQYVPRTWRRPPVENARAATHQQIHLGRPRQAVAAQPFTVKICPGPWGRRIASLGAPDSIQGSRSASALSRLRNLDGQRANSTQHASAELNKCQRLRLRFQIEPAIAPQYLGRAF